MTEQVIKGDIAIIKHTDDGETQIETPESGAEFQVFLKAAGSYDAAKESERDVLVCDENGFAQSKKLPYGTYIVRQTKGWEGRELMDDLKCILPRTDRPTATLSTTQILRASSRWSRWTRNRRHILMRGPVPNLPSRWQQGGNDLHLPDATTIDTFYTNSEGYLVTPEKLEYGTGYSLVEVQAPTAMCWTAPRFTLM